jgi:hypothetical protein
LSVRWMVTSAASHVRFLRAFEATFFPPEGLSSLSKLGTFQAGVRWAPRSRSDANVAAEIVSTSGVFSNLEGTVVAFTLSADTPTKGLLWLPSFHKRFGINVCKGLIKTYAKGIEQQLVADGFDAEAEKIRA